MFVFILDCISMSYLDWHPIAIEALLLECLGSFEVPIPLGVLEAHK